VFSSPYPDPAWRIPFLHSLFENAAAVASGVEAAYKALNKGPVNIIAQGGDGSTSDIGFQCMSGMFERGHNVLYVCYDNEAYMNTGVQRSGFTPHGARTTTTPAGNKGFKKNMPMIAADHSIPYIATCTVDDYRDLQRKVKTALSIEGPKYLHILAPCPLGWGHTGDLTVQICRLAKQTCLFPVFEIRDGKITNVQKVPAKKPVDEYLKLQGRFRHLFKKGVPSPVVAEIQAVADSNTERFNL
jgi:pyruvate ferredoxin oxidoreductase beta subunit